jgi:hypothetical protein
MKAAQQASRPTAKGSSQNPASSPSPSSGRGSAGKAAGIIAAAVIGLGVIGSGTSWITGAIGASDGVSLDVAADRQATWNDATTNGIALAPVPNDERSSAIASLGLPPQGQQALLTDVAAGKVQLGYLTVYDGAAEDGDTLQVQSSGLSTSVRLANAGTRIAVPYTVGAEIRIVGAVDGGGGITAGVRTPDGQLFTPVMQVGQMLSVRAK